MPCVPADICQMRLMRYDHSLCCGFKTNLCHACCSASAALGVTTAAIIVLSLTPTSADAVTKQPNVTQWLPVQPAALPEAGSRASSPDSHIWFQNNEHRACCKGSTPTAAAANHSRSCNNTPRWCKLYGIDKLIPCGHFASTPLYALPGHLLMLEITMLQSKQQ